MPVSPSVVLPRRIPVKIGAAIKVAPLLLETAHAGADDFLRMLQTSPKGLSEEEVARRALQHGLNVVAQEQRFTRLRLLGKAMVNPLVILLLVLAVVSLAMGDPRRRRHVAHGVFGVVLRFVQETRADTAAAKLKAMISVTATVLRDGPGQGDSARPIGARRHRATRRGRHDPGRSAPDFLQGFVSHAVQPDGRSLSRRKIRCSGARCVPLVHWN